MIEEKVYCEGCKYLDCLVHPVEGITLRYFCTHLENTEVEKSALRKHFVYKNIEKVNSENDCPLFEKKKRLSIIGLLKRIKILR